MNDNELTLLHLSFVQITTYTQSTEHKTAALSEHRWVLLRYMNINKEKLKMKLQKNN